MTAPTSLPPTTVPDGPVVIIGGGVIGCSLAHHLALYGRTDVTVLEAGLLAEGSTAKATGGIRTQFSSRLNADLSAEAVEYFASFEDRVGEPFDFRRHGYLFVFTTPAQQQKFERDTAMQRDLGIDARLLDPAEVADLVPGIETTDVLGGAYTPGDGSGSPTDAAAAFARQARRRGVGIRQHTRVVEVERDSGGAVTGVRTDGGELVPAGLVINAAGPWAGVVAGLVDLTLPIAPTPRQAFAIKPLPRLTADLPLTVDLATGAYVHPERAGGVVGGNDRGADPIDPARTPEVRWEATEPLIDALVHRLPWMVDAEVTTGWCGLREMTPDDHAIIGPSEVPGWWTVAGFSGHGFMQAPVIGDHVARWLVGRTDRRDLSMLSGARFTGTSDAGDAGLLAAESTVF